MAKLDDSTPKGPGRFWDLVSLVGWLFVLPAVLLVCGLPRASTPLLQASLGPFGASSSLFL